MSADVMQVVLEKKDKAVKARLKQKERKKRKQGKKKNVTKDDNAQCNFKISNEVEAVKIREKSNLILGEKDKVVAKQNKANQVLPANEVKEAEKPVVEKKSKKRRKLERRLPIAVLKQLVARPDLVEIHDTCAGDPFLLMHLKAYHNSVPVPRHWSQKRKYLQGKRGIEKPPFDLPFFIKKTGIMDVRNAGIEKDSHKTLKQEQREKLNPSMGRLDIDYQVLHDAFFKYQTKPKMTYFGDLYYEGKEYEVEMKEKRPGILSKELKESLGMPEGAPPPWLINMQRVGPPPSYPHLKIPGLNAPIPPGAEYGYHPGGWGRPPVDEHNRPLYSDAYAEEEIIKPTPYNEITHWGKLPSDEEPSSEEQPADQESEEEEEDNIPGVTDIDVTGIETPLSGLETPQNIDNSLRKQKEKEKEKEKPAVLPPLDKEKELYRVLEEREASVGSAVFGSNKQYVIEKAKKPKLTDRVETMKSQKTEGIELALDPSELANLTEEGLIKKYDKVVQEKKDKDGKTPDDKKRKRSDGTSSTNNKKAKKYKDFKF